MLFDLFGAKLQEYYRIPQTFSFSGNGTGPKYLLYLCAHNIGEQAVYIGELNTASELVHCCPSSSEL